MPIDWDPALRSFSSLLLASLLTSGCSGLGNTGSPLGTAADVHAIPIQSPTEDATAIATSSAPTTLPSPSSVKSPSPKSTSSPISLESETPSPQPTSAATNKTTAYPSATPMLGPTASASGVRPYAADALAESIGINTHVVNYLAASGYSTFVSLVKELGVRHIRDGILDRDDRYDSAMTQLLAATGAKLDGITDCAGIEYYSNSPTSPADIQAFNIAIGDRLEDIEGPNEVDARNDKNWVSDSLGCISTLKSAEPKLPFIAPSLADPYHDAPKLASLVSDVDFGNEHRYFSGHNPGSLGWGPENSCGVYGAVKWAICEAAVDSGTKPVMVTETGYNSQTELDETTQAKYLSRVVLVNLRAGNARTYIYSFKDYVGGDGFGGDGLVRMDYSTKPSYAALRSEIAYFSDSGYQSPLTPLTYAISNADISNILFQKNDGSYILALWNETPSWDSSAKRRISVPPQSIAITFRAAPQSVSEVSMNDAGTLATEPVSTSGTIIDVSVDDHVTFVRFKAH